MKNRKHISVLSICIVLLFFLTACTNEITVNSEGKPVIKIGYLPITHAAPLYIEEALAEEGFEHFELELVKFGSWVDLMDALNTGRIDGASVLATIAMRGKEMDIDLRAVALSHREGNAIIVANDMDRVEDLKGKTFAIPHKISSHHVLLYLMLKQAGIAYDHVNVVEMPPAEMPAALSEGRIAGYAVAEPFGAQAVVQGVGKVLFQEDELWEHAIDCALVLRGELIDGYPQAAQEFVEKYIAAGIKAEKEEQKADQIIQEYMNVNDEVLELSMEWISYDDLKINEKSYEQLREFLIELELLEDPPQYEEFVDNSLIEKVM